jgi:methyl-accepting chemotaxis protein
MDQMTQRNASMVEESTAASHSLSEETEQLSGLIGQFRLGRATENDDALRRELQKAAPHAFQPTADAIAKRTRAETREPAVTPEGARRQTKG